MSDEKFKRVNVLISTKQYELAHALGLNLSGLIRDLLDDRFSQTSIALSVDAGTRDLYDKIVSNFGSADEDLEPYLRKALDEFLADKIKEIDLLRKELLKEG